MNNETRNRIKARVDVDNGQDNALLRLLWRIVDQDDTIVDSDIEELVRSPAKRDQSAKNLNLILIVSFLLHRHDLVSNALQEAFCLGVKITVGTDQRINRPYIILLKKVYACTIELTFSDTLEYQLDDIDIQLLWLEWIMPLICSIAVSDKVQPGMAFLNQYDAGIVPGLSYCANTESSFLIPDNLFIPTLGYAQHKTRLSQDLTPWSQRTEMAFWRGASTGQFRSTKDGWRSLQRIELCKMSALNPTLS